MKKIFLKIIFFYATMNCISAQQNNVCEDIGMNLFYVNYWSREVPFSNLMMQASPWVACNSDWKFDEKDNYSISDKIAKDANGYPLSLPQNIAGQTKSQIVKSIVAWDNGGILPKGKYTLRYDGDGEIELFGLDTIAIIKQEKGLIEFNLRAARAKSDTIFGLLGGGLGIVIRKSLQSNPIKNIRILLPNTNETDANYPFNPSFLQKLKPFKAIRFLNWAGAYWSSDVEWSKRRPATYYTQMNIHDSWEARSVAYEYMIKLCNILERDMWLPVAYQINENYATELGKLVMKDLNPNLKVYLEYGNEVWNLAFPFNIQYAYVQNNAPASLQNQDHQYRYAHFANRIFKAFNSSPSPRVVRVLSGQQGSSSVLERSVKGMAFVAAAGQFDAGSVTDYMFQNEAINQLSATPTIKDAAKAYRAAMQTSLNYMQQNLDVLQPLGKNMISYEGGVHALVAPNDNSAKAKTLLAFAKDTSFYNISREWLSKVKALGNVKMQMAFVLADDKYGHWNIQNIFTDNASNSLKYKALLDHCGVVLTGKNTIETPFLLQIFPNPTQGNLQLQFDSEAQRNLQLYDLTGKLLLQKSLFSVSEMLDLSDLASGFYLLRVAENGKSVLRKIVKE